MASQTDRFSNKHQSLYLTSVLRIAYQPFERRAATLGIEILQAGGTRQVARPWQIFSSFPTFPGQDRNQRLGVSRCLGKVDTCGRKAEGEEDGRMRAEREILRYQLFCFSAFRAPPSALEKRQKNANLAPTTNARCHGIH
jgi:hypothetical protein